MDSIDQGNETATGSAAVAPVGDDSVGAPQRPRSPTTTAFASNSESKRRFAIFEDIGDIAQAVVRLAVVALPWRVRRVLLVRFWGYELHETSRIGFAWVFPKHLIMGPYSRIDHLTVCRSAELIHLEEFAYIGRLNWIYGYSGNETYQRDEGRRSELILERHSTITCRHIVDCTNWIHIGSFATIAGYRSQLLTHSIDLLSNRQASKPITISDYCFVGSGCIILGGSILPSHSVLGAASLLNKQHTDTYTLYGGVAAQRLAPLSADYGYFLRTEGHVG